jgi:hypothetical protein
MPRLVRRATFVVSVAIAGLSFGAERADAIAFDAPAECGSAQDFAARVGGHAGRPVAVSSTAPVRVVIKRVPKGFRGTLNVVEDGVPSERAIDGHTCAEVVDALALVTSIALGEVETAPEASVSEAPSASAPPPVSASASVAPEATAAPPPVASAPKASSTYGSRWSIGARLDGLLLDSSPAPFGASLHGEWSLVDARARDGFLPAVRLEVERLGVERSPVEGSTVTLSWTLAELDLCPLRLDRGVRLDVCALASGGVLGVSSTGLAESTSVRRSWFALGGLLRARVELGAGFHLEGRAAGISPVTRDSLVIDPGIEAYRASPFALAVGAGVGWYFP